MFLPAAISSLPEKPRPQAQARSPHAYAAEPQLFEGVELEDKPISWSEVVRKSDRFSFAETIQSGLRHYDWTDLLP